MHALTLARQRLRAQLQHPATPRPVRLAHGMVESGKGRYLPVLSSPLAQEILARGYDAATLDRVYANRPSAELGLVGRMADRVVLDLPAHSAFRERLEAAVGEICAAAVFTLRGGEETFRVLSAPCGLGQELVGMARRLRAGRPELFGQVRAWGVDPDRDGRFLAEAARRTREAGLAAEFIREDLRRHREVAAVVSAQGPFHLISCLGVSQAFTSTDMADLIRFYSGLLAPGGTLLVDRWEPAEKTPVAEGLDVQFRHYPVREFRAHLAAAGLTLQREHATGEGGCVLAVARKA